MYAKAIKITEPETEHANNNKDELAIFRINTIFTDEIIEIV